MRQISEENGVELIYLLLGSENQTEKLNNFQQTLIDYTQENDLPLINMIDRQKTLDHSELYIDHTHPSAKGHRLIAEALKPVVQNLLTEEATTPTDDGLSIDEAAEVEEGAVEEENVAELREASWPRNA